MVDKTSIDTIFNANNKETIGAIDCQSSLQLNTLSTDRLGTNEKNTHR